MKSKLEKSIEYIAGYCNKHDSCASCPLAGEEGCILCNEYHCCDWPDALKKIQEQRKRRQYENT